MAIPPLNQQGLLPAGIHDVSVDELRSRFGSFQGNERRVHLWAALEKFLSEARKLGAGILLLVNGSFVTAKAAPNDIDLILVLPSGFEFSRDFSPAEYNVLSAQRVRRRFGLDLLVARVDSDQYHRYVKLFQQVRLEPGVIKGILRLKL